MENIVFKNDFIRLEFVVENERIYLSFVGNELNYINKKSTIVELETLDGDHLGNHCTKECNTPYSKTAKYVSHTIKGNRLSIITKTDEIEVETNYILYENTSGFSVFNNVKNICKNAISLEYISSFYLYGLGQNDNPTCKNMNVYYASNSWHTEAQWKKESFVDANIFNANNRITMKRFVLNNSGSWSTKDYLPMIGVENERSKQFLLAQIEHNGSWHIEIADNENSYYLSVNGPCLMDNQWSHKLKENEVFVTPQASVVFGDSFEKCVQEITKLRRFLIDRNHIDYIEQPICFNDFMHGTWDLSTEELIKPLIDVSSKVGCEEFVIDAGWFAETTGWPNFIGDYEEYSDNFPSGGLKGLFDYIRSKGMKTGLWFEIENVGIQSKAAKDLPEDFFMHINGVRFMRNSRYCLNFANPKVVEYATRKIGEAIDKYNLDYIKLDYNLDLGTGNTDDCYFLGDGLFAHNNGVIKFIDLLHEKYPNLTIENCSSGGQRLDYKMLSHTQLMSSSDLENYFYYPYISGNILTASIPEQAGIWSYPVCNDNTKCEITDEVVVFNMVNSMIGRVHLASFINKLQPTQLDLVSEAITMNKNLKIFKKEAVPVFPNGFSRFFENSVVSGLKNSNEIYLFVFNMMKEKQDVIVDLSKYKIDKIEQIYPHNMQIKFVLKKGKLVVKFPDGLMGRTFKVTIL